MGEMSPEEREVRRKIVSFCREMNATGLNQGTSGNISARFEGDMLITPSGVPYAELEPESIVRATLEGEEPRWSGDLKPSSEWHFHRAILKAKPEQGAIVHTHSTFATVLSIARRGIPACHYMIAAFGGPSVRCADYATFGTPELSANVIRAMEDRSACLLANHGMIACGANLDKAMWAAMELETLSKQYFHALQLGDMTVLDDREMARVARKFKSYGPRAKKTAGKGGRAAARAKGAGGASR